MVKVTSIHPSAKAFCSSKSGDIYVHIGLEIHCQIKSARKLFSPAPVSALDVAPNHSVSFVDIAAPGMLPVLNSVALEQGIRMGLALNGTINSRCVFDRKHYFYPDNPAGYQISQHQYPLVEHGSIIIPVKDSDSKETYEKSIRILRLHLEQDAGKSIHDTGSESLIDFNRAGVGLMEIVSHPDLSSPEEAASYVEHIQKLARYTKASDADMEKGQMRVDVNISISHKADVLGTRAEIKNMNSVRFLKAALCYEIERHIEHLEHGIPILQETRGFDPKKGVTFSMRSKEEAEDYRYFPDPDLPAVYIEEDLIRGIQARMPELFDAKCKRFMKELHLSEYDSRILTENPEVADFFESTLQAIPQKDFQKDPSAFSKAAANWITGSIFSVLVEKSNIYQEVKFSTQQFSEFLVNVVNKTFSTPVAKEIFQEMVLGGGSVQEIIQQKGIQTEKVMDKDLLAIMDQVSAESSKQVAEYLLGKEKLFMFFVGQTMKKLQGRGDPEHLQKLWKIYLDKKKHDIHPN